MPNRNPAAARAQPERPAHPERRSRPRTRWSTLVTVMMRLYRIIRYPPQYAKDMAESHQLYAVLESQQANTRHELRLVDKEIRDMRDSLKHLGTPPR